MARAAQAETGRRTAKAATVIQAPFADPARRPGWRGDGTRPCATCAPSRQRWSPARLKGFSHKRIGKLTDRSERTARQHAVAVYRKSGCAGRSELAAFFLEGVLLPARQSPSESR